VEAFVYGPLRRDESDDESYESDFYFSMNPRPACLLAVPSALAALYYPPHVQILFVILHFLFLPSWICIHKALVSASTSRIERIKSLGLNPQAYDRRNANVLRLLSERNTRATEDTRFITFQTNLIIAPISSLTSNQAIETKIRRSLHEVRTAIHCSYTREIKYLYSTHHHHSHPVYCIQSISPNTETPKPTQGIYKPNQKNTPSSISMHTTHQPNNPLSSLSALASTTLSKAACSNLPSAAQKCLPAS
jgi:hypothetical protein